MIGKREGSPGRCHGCISGHLYLHRRSGETRSVARGSDLVGQRSVIVRVSVDVAWMRKGPVHGFASLREWRSCETVGSWR